MGFSGDIMFSLLPLFISLIPTILIIIIIVYVIKVIRRSERRAEERLQLDRENTTFQQLQTESINELNKRLIVIENLLKEVE